MMRTQGINLTRNNHLDSELNNCSPVILHLSWRRKSAMYVIDAKTMAADAVAVVELPHRVPYGFHGIFVTEVS